MTVLDLLRLALVVVAPSMAGAAIVCAPRGLAWITRIGRRRPPEPEPMGLPIEQLAADLRRLLRLHTELSDSAHIAIRAYRLWSVEAAIGVRAVEAARALGVPHREPGDPAGGEPARGELCLLLRSLAGAGLVLPAQVGPFTANGRL